MGRSERPLLLGPHGAHGVVGRALALGHLQLAASVLVLMDPNGSNWQREGGVLTSMVWRLPDLRIVLSARSSTSASFMLASSGANSDAKLALDAVSYEP